MAVAEEARMGAAGPGASGEAAEATMAMGAAARELELKRGEFVIAAHLGLIRLTASRDGRRSRVGCGEVERLRSQEGFPDVLRARVRTVGTAQGAEQLGISPDRFTKLARAGCLTPIAFYLNRYRAVVWLYLADEIADFGAREPRLLEGRSPAWLLGRLADGADCRARNWRSRRVERLCGLTEDPWARAAVLAETLDPVQLAEVVDDPYERAYLARIGPEPVFGPVGPPWARETMARLMRADEPDELLWRRVTLIMELDNARDVRPAPRPDGAWRDLAPAGPEAGGGTPGQHTRVDVDADAAPCGEADRGAVGSVVPSGGGLLARIGRFRRTRRAADRRRVGPRGASPGRPSGVTAVRDRGARKALACGERAGHPDPHDDQGSHT
ncbi:DUF6397 family protein [Streptomyces sp. NPDC092952]|uniref:DUF6397 family protein n=1 Tax=Streptomyces sp. NPDC092952 TaxID=3366018 RepID=UPI0037FCD72B